MRKLKLKKHIYDVDVIEKYLNEGYGIKEIAYFIKIPAPALRHFLKKFKVVKIFHIHVHPSYLLPVKKC